MFHSLRLASSFAVPLVQWSNTVTIFKNVDSIFDSSSRIPIVDLKAARHLNRGVDL